VALRIVGAGLGRTGTHSFKLAVEQLTGARCYHMVEVIERPQEATVWHAALRGDTSGLPALLADSVATCDWPACTFWRELAALDPDATVVLTTRDSAQEWWASIDRTIFAAARAGRPSDDAAAERWAMFSELLDRFTPRWNQRDAAIAAYEAHNQAVRDGVPADRLVEWRASDGWAPICQALGVPVPSDPFPRVNSTAEFRARAGLDEDAAQAT
jgi:hypothetical protein